MTDQAHLTAEKTYRAIGRFVFEFSQLEYAIRHYVAEEVGVMTEYFNAIMTHDFATLCTGAIEVFRHSYSDKRERFEKMERLLNRARTLGNERNSVAHGLWVPFQDGGKVIHVPRSLKAKISTEQAKTLEEKADQANALRAEIEALALDME